MKLTIGDLIPHGAPPPVTGTTWNPGDKSADITLSGGNLIATRAGVANGNRLARATTSKSSGKWYMEATNTNGSGTTGGQSVYWGLTTAAAALTANVGQSGVGFASDGNIFIAGAAVGSPVGVWTLAGKLVQCAVDLTAMRIWFRVQGGLWLNNPSADPATGTAGISISAISNPLFPAVSLFNFNTPNEMVGNFGNSAFAGAIPAGFAAWG